MTFDHGAAIQKLRSIVLKQSNGMCAKHVRIALEAGGLNLDDRPNYACHYGSYLEARGFVGFVPDSWDQYTPEPGDVAVMPPYNTGHPAGHIAMYCGERQGDWLSDFVQKDMWGGPGFRNHKAGTKVYRYPHSTSQDDPGTGAHDIG